MVHYHASKDEALDTVAAIRRLDVDAWAIAADLASPEESRRLFSAAVETAGPIDYLVNSASIFPSDTLDDLSEPSILENLRINTLAPFILSRSLHSQERKGCIVNYLDARIVDYDRRHVSYHVSKRVLFDLTRMMSLEYAPLVRVNSVAPGLVLPPHGESDAWLERYAHTNPLQTHGTKEQVSAAALFLIWNEFITGQVLFVDGGRHLNGSTYGV